MKLFQKSISTLMIAAVVGTGLAVPYNVWQGNAQAVQAEEAPAVEAVKITSLSALNPITVEVTFSAPLAKEEIVLDVARQNFVFTNGVSIRNIPQLKTGTTSTYIVPTTVQQPGTAYTLAYKGQNAVAFEASTDKIDLRSVRQVSYDTFEVESRLKDGVTDYSNIVAAYAGMRGGLDFVLDENNSYKGKTYQIISSMRGAQVYITPEGGETMTATYVPFTQNTDGKQEPKFRLANGQTLKPGTKYTVTADWATIKNAKFKARKLKPLAIEKLTAVNETTIDVTLAKDPKDELFASRRIELTAADGTKLTAQYKVTTRKGATGIFELVDGGKLASDMTYTVSPVGPWASANEVTLTTN